ncbi:hypothetical protein SprV_0401447400 [Sparganum proliferum]
MLRHLSCMNSRISVRKRTLHSDKNTINSRGVLWQFASPCSPPLSRRLPVRLTFLVDTLLGRARLVTSLASARDQSTLSLL